MDLDKPDPARTDLDAYQERIRAIDRDLVRAAMDGNYRRAGRAYAALLECQARMGMLPSQPEYSEILRQLDTVPSKAAGICPVGA